MHVTVAPVTTVVLLAYWGSVVQIRREHIIERVIDNQIEALHVEAGAARSDKRVSAVGLTLGLTDVAEVEERLATDSGVLADVHCVGRRCGCAAGKNGPR